RLPVGSSVAAFVRPRASGGYVVGTERGVALADRPHEAPGPARELWSDPGVRMNEGATAPDGSLYAGSMAYDARQGAGTLFRIDPEQQVEVALTDVGVSNGLGFSPAGDVAYYNDTATGRTDAFTVTGDRLGERHRFVAHDDGAPDGLCVDSRGNVWVALHGAGTVRCFSPAGALLDEVHVPVRQVTACTLGGPDLRRLYIT
ncbi:SMP-30/gluconolactonase/LRE family protein, partial [Georgenia sp. 10Sc9-8]|nr:SMP-30/gluconolactonase/LRE family protein [Georgenia halotolerans]